MSSPPWTIVTRREIVSKVTDKAFIIGTVLMLAMISGFVLFQVLWGERTQTHTIAVLPADTVMADTVARGVPTQDSKVRIDLRAVDSPRAAEQAVMDGKASAWLHHRDGAWVLTGKKDVDSGLERAVSVVVRRSVIEDNARAAGTDVAAIEQGATMATDLLVGDAEQQDFARFMGFALAILFYMASLGFGFTIAGSVVEEKASRIVEIIATKIPIRQLLVGKVLGNTILAVAQTAIFVGVGLLGLSFTSYKSLLPAVSSGVGWFLVYFLIGFLLIACLFAVVGALASRSEDLQQTGMPMTMLLMVVFFASFLATGTALTVLSHIPPFSAVLMPIRVLQGTAAWWEPWVALVVLLAAAGVVILVAERLYRRALLQTQGRLSIRQAWTVAE